VDGLNSRAWLVKCVRCENMTRTIELDIMDRINILQVLPKEENFATLKLVRKIADNIGLTESEFAEWEIKEDVEKKLMTWKEDTDTTKEYTFGEKSFSIIRNALKKLDREKKITNQFFNTYEKFVGDDNEEEDN